MGSNYPGSGAAFPPIVWLPDDGDDRTAASVNAALTTLADRSAYLYGRLTASSSQTFLASGTFNVPARCRLLIAVGYGGGGGGASGTVGAKAVNQRAGGGGGGGAGVLTVRVIPVAPGDVLTVRVGAGGAGGPLGAVGDGERSWIVNGAQPEAPKAFFPGGGAGSIAGGAVNPDQHVLYCAGGCAGGALPGGTTRGAVMPAPLAAGAGVGGLPMTAGQGGCGSTLDGGTDCAGASDAEGRWPGGSGGSIGQDAAVNDNGFFNYYCGGGAGGGGGAGPGGSGGNGGNGANGNAGGGGLTGGPGGTALPNTGAGGGGGGGGGAASTGVAGGAGGLGGSGGSGMVTIFWLTEGV